MKNMALLIDTNVLLNYVAGREPGYRAATHIVQACKMSGIKGYIAFHTLPTIWYVMRKSQVINRRNVFLNILDYLTVVSVPHETVIDALKDKNFADFEDCLQEKCALAVNADYIVTENIKDFTASTVPAITAAGMLRTLYNMDGELPC